MRGRQVAAGACLLVVLNACSRPVDETVPPPAATNVEQTVPPAPPQAPEPTNPVAEVALNDTAGQQVATAHLREQAEGVMVTLNAASLPSGLRGFHFHEGGHCAGPSFASAGGHFNPTRREHGFENPQGPHLGDLPNLVIQRDGTATQTLLARNVTLAAGRTSVRGRSLVVHAERDDYGTDPSGNSGDRVACGIVPGS